MSQKRFLLIASFAESLINFRGPLIKALQMANMQVHVAAPDLPINGSLRMKLESQGLVVHEIPLKRTGFNPFVDLVLLFELLKVIRATRPDYVMAYTIKPVIYGMLAARLSHLPNRFALITGLGYAFQNFDVSSYNKRSLLQRLVQNLYRFSLSGTQMVFFQNPDDQKLFRSLDILKSDALSCVLNGSGVDVIHFKVVPVPSSPHFLLIARLLGDKGVREYVQAARRIKETYPHVKFSLAGWIDDNPDSISSYELKSWVTKQTVYFLGRLSDVRDAIADCSVYVLPSYREGTPRTVLEAMSMGRAIITTDAPGCRETVINGDNGFLISVKSVDELAVAMERFILDPDLARHLGERSRQIAEEKYDVHKVNEVMLREMGL